LNNLVIACPIGLHIDSRGMTWKQWNDPEEPSWCLEDKAKRLNYTQPPWSTKYPRLAAIMQEEPRQPLGNTVRRNIFVDCTKQVCDFDGNVKMLLDKFEIIENVAVNTTGTTNGTATFVPFRGFTNLSGTKEKPVDLPREDMLARGSSFRWRAWLQKEMPSFETIPFEQIGLQKDEYRRTLPAR
jgi:hypothetical protein